MTPALAAQKVWQFPLVIALCGAVAVGASLNLISERLTKAILSSTEPLALSPLPLLQSPSYAAALRAEDPHKAHQWLDEHLKHRPLFAPAWLQKAEIERKLQMTKDAAISADIAQSLWPYRPLHLWQVVNFYINLGEDQRAIDALERYLIARPGEALRVLVLARRIESDPEILAQRFGSLPTGRYSEKSAPAHAIRLLSAADRFADAELAREFWRVFTPEIKTTQSVAFRFIDAMLNAGDNPSAIAAWAGLGKEAIVIPQINNGDFELPLAEGGLGWRTRELKGARIRLDREIYWSGKRSLAVHFDGTENLNYYHLSQRILIEPKQRYLISGWWRGNNISTRSGMYLDAYTQNPWAIARSEPRRASWPWEPFSFEFDAPEGVNLLTLRLRRNKTDALDNLLSGSIWLDGIEIKALGAAN